MAISIKSLIGALIGMVIGLALFPTVTEQVDAINTTGITGGTLITLLPMVYILIIFGGAIGYVYVANK
jgi:hypothetical protein